MRKHLGDLISILFSVLTASVYFCWKMSCFRRHRREVMAGHMLTSEYLPRSCDSQGSDPGRLPPLVMHVKTWGGQCSSHLASLSVISSASLWELGVSLQYRRMHTGSPQSLLSYKLKCVEIRAPGWQLCGDENLLVFHCFTDDLVQNGVCKCVKDNDVIVISGLQNEQ